MPTAKAEGERGAEAGEGNSAADKLVLLRNAE